MPVTADQISALGQFRTKPIGDDEMFVWSWSRFLQTLEVARQNAPQYFFNSASHRTQTDASKVGIGSFFYETDTKKYFISNGTAWIQLGTAP